MLFPFPPLLRARIFQHIEMKGVNAPSVEQVLHPVVGMPSMCKIIPMLVPPRCYVDAGADIQGGLTANTVDTRPCVL